MSTIDLIKDGANVLKEAGKIEQYKEILNLLDEVKIKQGRIEKMEEQIKELEHRQKTDEKLEVKNNSYWLKEDGPFCTRCWDIIDKLVRLHTVDPSSDYATCPECKNTINFTGRADNYEGAMQDYINS